MTFPNILQQSTATILSGATTSDVIDLGGGQSIIMLDMPAAFTGTFISFLVSYDNITYKTYYRDYNMTTFYFLNVGTNRYIGLQYPLEGFRYLKLVSSASEAATRLINVISRPT